MATTSPDGSEVTAKQIGRIRGKVRRGGLKEGGSDWALLVWKWLKERGSSGSRGLQAALYSIVAVACWQGSLAGSCLAVEDGLGLAYSSPSKGEPGAMVEVGP